MFDFGDLDILTASEAGIDRLRMIRDPVGYKRAMLDAKHEYERDMSRGSGPASPPLRAAPVERDRDPTSTVSVPELAPAAGHASGAPVTVSPAPAAGSRPHMSPDEVMRTLATLADLRDRGAISAEDYEGKKSELLGRL
jgi:Short C-terminal domain